jgi:hypothetical protein
LKHSRTSRQNLLAVSAMLFVLASACETPGTVSGSATCKQGTARVAVFQGPSGHCLPRDRLVEYRCEGQAPEIVIDAGSARERRFLGGGFATRIGQLPAGAQVLGVGDGTQGVVLPDADQWLFTVKGAEVQRWLALPPAETVRSDGPTAFMIGDSILDGGQYAIAAALPDWTLGVDALNGRGSVSGVSIAEAQAEAGNDAVVVELGTNDQSPEVFREHARAILSALKSTPLVLWQTVQGPPGVVQAEEVNTAIRELVGARPSVAIADWAGLVGEEELSYDGVHPDLGHEDAMARVVAPMLTRWWNATTADEPGCT